VWTIRGTDRLPCRPPGVARSRFHTQPQAATSTATSLREKVPGPRLVTSGARGTQATATSRPFQGPSKANTPYTSSASSRAWGQGSAAQPTNDVPSAAQRTGAGTVSQPSCRPPQTRRHATPRATRQEATPPYAMSVAPTNSLAHNPQGRSCLATRTPRTLSSCSSEPSTTRRCVWSAIPEATRTRSTVGRVALRSTTVSRDPSCTRTLIVPSAMPLSTSRYTSVPHIWRLAAEEARHGCRYSSR